jgi:AraC-like DNA-binding protein
VLDSRTLLDRDGLSLADVRCTHGAGRGEDEPYAGRHAIVLVRRGCFVRSADGREALVDPTLAYTMAPGEEHRYDHPHGHGDDCTAVFLSDEVVASVWGGDAALPSGVLATSPVVDLEHRRVLAAARRGEDAHEVFEGVLGVVAGLLEARDGGRVRAGRPATARARRALADGVREALAERPSLSLPALASLLAVSPHHLSRVFREQTGTTIARHRMRLRARRALERLGEGERDLARVAADEGFADQAHLCRVLKAETGATPSALRAMLA